MQSDYQTPPKKSTNKIHHAPKKGDSTDDDITQLQRDELYAKSLQSNFQRLLSECQVTNPTKMPTHLR